jgi:two-component system, sensor histidine kinase PdtaS
MKTMKVSKIMLIGVLIICQSILARSQPRNDRAPKDLLVLLAHTKADTDRVKLQLELGYHYLEKPGALKTDIDSAFTFFRPAMQLSIKLHNEKWKNETLKLLGEAYFRENDLAHGKACFLSAINNYRIANQQKDEAMAWMRYGICLPSRDTAGIRVKRDILFTAFLRLKKLNSTTDALEVLRATANEDINRQQLDLAETEYLQIVAQSKGIHNRHLFYVYSSLGDISKLRGDLRQDLFYRIEAVKTLDDSTDVYRQKLAYYKLGQVYFDLNLFDKSLVFYQKGFAFKKSAINVDYRMYMAYVRTLIAMHRGNEALLFLKSKKKTLSPLLLPENRMMDKSFALCYTALKQYDNAEQSYVQVLKIDSQIFKEQLINDVQAYVSDYGELCDMYLSLKQYKKAGVYADKFFKLDQNMISPIDISHAHLIEFKVDSASGGYLAAINHFEKHTQLNDSLYNETKSRQISELAVRYETAAKEKSILSLQSREQEDHSAYQKVSMQRNLILLGGLFLLIILFVGYNGYRRNKRSNLKLQKKQFEIDLQNNSLRELNEKQRHLITEKEWLLREIHHRVKNSLQTTMSLLNMQSSYLSNTDAIDAIQNSQRRMHSMSLVHQTLYRSDSIAMINMKTYINELLIYLKESFQKSEEIKVDLKIQSIELDTAIAIPIGLIINEAVTNALKYAFPGNRKGRITIRFEADLDDNIKFSIADDGIGIPEHIFFEPANSLGINLIKGLTEQINGTLDFQGTSGTLLTVTFRASQQEQEHVI